MAQRLQWLGSMKTKQNGRYFEVTVSANEIREFRVKWPCSGLLLVPHWFQFEQSNGDLVDCNVEYGNNGTAIAALADDAKAYGQGKLA